MKKEFFEYFQPSKSEFEHIWGECVFSFDASVLLDLYRFSASGREELLAAIKTVGDRVWISHQAAYEFNKHRLNIMAEAHSRADRLINRLKETADVLAKETRQHPYLDTTASEPICKSLIDAAEKLAEVKAQSPTDDEVGAELLEILDGRVGAPYAADKIAELHKEIDARYERKIPPGYSDFKEKTKPGSSGDPYGDCVVWFQLLDYAVDKKVPVVFITRDKKEDWWTKINGRTIQPRHELRREFRNKTGQDIYLYETPQFIQFLKLSPELVKEAQVLAANPPGSEEGAPKQDQSSTDSAASTSSGQVFEFDIEAWSRIVSEALERIKSNSPNTVSTLLTSVDSDDAGKKTSLPVLSNSSIRTVSEIEDENSKG